MFLNIFNSTIKVWFFGILDLLKSIDFGGINYLTLLICFIAFCLIISLVINNVHDSSFNSSSDSFSDSYSSGQRSFFGYSYKHVYRPKHVKK